MLQLRLLHSYGPIAQTDFTVDQMIKVHLLARSVEAVEVNGYTIEPGTNLGGANLTVAFLVGANLEGANLYRAKANEDTTWPEGFDPEAAGVIFED